MTTFGHSGRWITHPDGRIAVLRGFNLVNKVSPYHLAAMGFDERHAAFIARHGFNAIRTGIIWKALEPQPGRYDDEYLGYVRETIRLCHRHGLHVLLDFHQDMANERFGGEGWPDWAVGGGTAPARPNLGFPWNYFLQPALIRAFDRFWANDPAPDGVGLQDHYAAAWRHVARTLCDESGIVGYDILNEPFPGSSWPRGFWPRGDPRFDQRLTEFHRRCLHAIREVDPLRLVFYEPTYMFDAGVDTHHGDLDDSAVGFSFHAYAFVAAPGVPTVPGPPQDWLGRRQERRILRLAEQQARNSNAALVLSEWGGMDSLRAVRRMAVLADNAMLSWHHWSYASCDMPQESPEWGLVHDLHEAPEDLNVKWQRLAALTRPYPRAVAGLPLSWSFDEATRKWCFAYQARRVADDSESDLSPTVLRTEIAVPPLRYRRGYKLRVSDASVVSASNAAIIELEADPDRKVEIELTPA
jgi:endoglycosylceramidase